MKRLFVLCAICVICGSLSAQTPDDLAAVFSAWGVHQAGFTVTFQNGPRPPISWICRLWGCLPYKETPADFRTWDFGRVLYWADDLSHTARLPGQPADCQLAGFARTNNAIFGRCYGGSIGLFTPAIPPGAYRAFLESLTPSPAERIIP